MSAPRDPAATASRNDVRMDGVHFDRVCASGPLAGALAAGNFSYCVAVRAGRLRLTADFPTVQEVDLGPGDVVAVSGLVPHVFRTADAPPGAAPQIFQPLPLAGGPPACDVELVVGCVPNEAIALGSLSVGLILVRPAEHPDLSRRLWRAVEMLEDEYADASWLDRSLVIRRLAEIMLVNMTRRTLAEGGRDPRDGMRPAAGRQLAQAINAFLETPDRPWSLEQMARAAGMSRTRFAETFKLATGQTPARILSRLRLTAIAQRLASESLSVEAAAEEAGYSSAAAFVRAFQREFGETPARWRRARRSGAALRRDLPSAAAQRSEKHQRKPHVRS